MPSNGILVYRPRTFLIAPGSGKGGPKKTKPGKMGKKPFYDLYTMEGQRKLFEDYKQIYLDRWTTGKIDIVSIEEYIIALQKIISTLEPLSPKKLLQIASPEMKPEFSDLHLQVELLFEKLKGLEEKFNEDKPVPLRWQPLPMRSQ